MRILVIGIRGPYGRGVDLQSIHQALIHTGADAHMLAIPYEGDPHLENKKAALERCIGDNADLSDTILLFILNGDEVYKGKDFIGDDAFARARARIILPAWELPGYPKVWAQSLDAFDRIWVSSDYTQDALQKACSTPVEKIPFSVEIRWYKRLIRHELGLPQNEFLFYTSLDFSSYSERKAPFSVLEAFTRMKKQHPSGSGVKLVLKLKQLAGHPDKELHKAFFDRLNGYSDLLGDDLILLDRGAYSTNDNSNLTWLCDCYVSLHRAEGFGRMPAESMCLGRPAIITNYSGVREYARSDNSLLVNYTLIDVPKDGHPHWRGQKWADPDIDHAVKHMLRLSTDETLYARLSAKGKEAIIKGHSKTRAGIAMRDALSRVL